MKRAHFTKTGHKNVESLKITANFGGSADPPAALSPHLTTASVAGGTTAPPGAIAGRPWVLDARRA